MADAPPVRVVPPWRARLISGMKLGYALAAGVFSIWIASFVPAIGPRICAFIPGDALAAVQLRDGCRVYRLLEESPLARELARDPDFSAYLDEAKAQVENAHARLPEVVRRFFPLTPEGCFPLAGQETALVLLPPREDGGLARKKHSAPRLLIFTRLSGAGGALTRLGGRFAKLPSGLGFFDLGGGLIALGLNGAEPGEKSAPFVKLAGLAAPCPADAALARVWARPRLLIKPQPQDAGTEALRECPQYAQFAQALPKTVLEALLSPPGFERAANFDEPPSEAQIDFYAAGDGKILAVGRLLGIRLPPPGVSWERKSGDGAAYAEALLPVDARALFLRQMASELHPKPDKTKLARGQRRWLEIYQRLQADALDLDRDLWPAFGHVVNLEVVPPCEDSAWRQGVVRARVPFDGQAATLDAAREFFDLAWNHQLDRRPLEKLKCVRAGDAAGFVLGLQITAPAWALTPKQLLLTWDAGMLAYANPGDAIRKFIRRESRAFAAEPAKSYFLHWNGARMGPTVEALASHIFESLEEDMGAEEFLTDFPDPPRYVRLARKLSEVAGQLSLELTPGSGNAASLDLAWTPGAPDSSEKARDGKDSAPAPAPMPVLEDDGEDVAPPPPVN